MQPHKPTARLIKATSPMSPQAIWQQLQLAFPRSVILIIGGEGVREETSQLRLAQLVSRGMARAAQEMNIAFITNGMDVGLLTLLGNSAAEQGYQFPLIGIAAQSYLNFPDSTEAVNQNTVAVEAHHTHLVMTEYEEEDIALRVEITAFLAKTFPVIALLVGGSTNARIETLRCVRAGIPLLIMEGTGLLADEIATLFRDPPAFIPDALLAEIIADGTIHWCSITDTPAELERMIYRCLGSDTILQLAWKQFALYDGNAKRQQRHFQRLQVWILILGILGTSLALIQTTLEQYVHRQTLQETQLSLHAAEAKLQEVQSNSTVVITEKTMESVSPSSQPIAKENTLSYLWERVASGWNGFLHWLEPFMSSLIILLRYIILVIPILVTTLIAAVHRFNAGHKWVLLRASAEQLKREIFSYRVQAGTYSPTQLQEKTREVKLAEGLQAITAQLMQTEVNTSVLHSHPYDVKQFVATSDDGMSLLTPERYLQARLEDQCNYYETKAKQLERQLHWLQWATYMIGGVGTLLAALGLELWIALTTVLAAALVTYMEYRQLENTLMKYNQAAANLASTHHWWTALTPTEQAHQPYIDRLVEQTEGILQGEFSGWVREMQEALNTLKVKQTASQDIIPSPKTK